MMPPTTDAPGQMAATARRCTCAMPGTWRKHYTMAPSHIAQRGKTANVHKRMQIASEVATDSSRRPTPNVALPSRSDLRPGAGMSPRHADATQLPSSLWAPRLECLRTALRQKRTLGIWWERPRSSTGPHLRKPSAPWVAAGGSSSGHHGGRCAARCNPTAPLNVVR